MSTTLTIEDPQDPLRVAFALCAKDEPGENLRLVKVTSHYKSQQAFLGSNATTHPEYVVKISGGRWNAENEFRGLKYLEQVFHGKSVAEDALRFGAIRPVGYSLSPRLLVTRFQPGYSMRKSFDRALHTIPGWRAQATALRNASIMASWLRILRSSDVRSDGGFTPETFQAACEELVDGIQRHQDGDGAWATALKLVPGYLDQLSDDALTALRCARPSHGDFCAQNFHIGFDGTVYVLDVGAFDYGRFNIDLASFRVRLEHYLLRGLFVRHRARQLWQTFVDEYHAGINEPQEHGFLSYLFRVLQVVAYRSAEVSRVDSFGKLKTRVKDKLWFQSRRAWLTRLTGDLRRDLRLWHHQL